MQAFNSRTLLYSAFAVLIAIGATSAPALAAPATPAKVEKKAEASPQAMVSELQKIGAQLSQIERKAIAASPKLQAKRHHFSEHMVKVEKTLGYTPGADINKLVAIKKKILSGKLNKAEREAEIRKFTSIRQDLMKGQMAAMQDKSLSKESKALNEATMVAMRKTDPHTDDLIKQFNAIRSKLQTMMAQRSKAHK